MDIGIKGWNTPVLALLKIQDVIFNGLGLKTANTHKIERRHENQNNRRSYY